MGTFFIWTISFFVIVKAVFGEPVRAKKTRKREASKGSRKAKAIQLFSAIRSAFPARRGGPFEAVGVSSRGR